MLRRAAALDDAALRFLRTTGHSPMAESAARRFSALGEHAAVWLVLGAMGMVVDPGRRARWRRGVAAVGGVYVVNTAIKLAVRRRRLRSPACRR